MAISIGAYSEEILIMVAISNIGNLLTPGYELSLANKWMRVMISIFALFGGVAGLSIGILIHFTLLLSTETIKFPYLYPLIPFFRQGMGSRSCLAARSIYPMNSAARAGVPHLDVARNA